MPSTTHIHVDQEQYPPPKSLNIHTTYRDLRSLVWISEQGGPTENCLSFKETSGVCPVLVGMGTRDERRQDHTVGRQCCQTSWSPLLSNTQQSLQPLAVVGVCCCCSFSFQDKFVQPRLAFILQNNQVAVVQTCPAHAVLRSNPRRANLKFPQVGKKKSCEVIPSTLKKRQGQRDWDSDFVLIGQ